MTAVLREHPDIVDQHDPLQADFHRLAEYYRDRGLEGESISLAEFAYCDALVRHFSVPTSLPYRKRPQVVVFGGAGAGKSTVVNMMLGMGAADSNAQAGFTRRPTVYLRGETNDIHEWPVRIGPLAKLNDQDAHRDGDFYSVRMLDSAADAFVDDFAVWDCPDLTTKDAAYYEFRAIEIAALADVGVYVASDERYNDLLPTQFLQAMLDAGKPVIVVLTKVSILDAASLVDLFQKQVRAKLRRADNILAVIAVPSPGRTKVGQLWTGELPHAQQLRKAVRTVRTAAGVAGVGGAWSGAGVDHRRRLSTEVKRYLRERQSRLLDPVRKDVGEWRAWTEQARLAAGDAVSRYEREHLTRIDYPEFREAADRLEAAFALSPPLDVLWRVFEILRFPVRWLTGQLSRSTPFGSRPLATDVALDRVRRSLIEQLHVAVSARRGRHRLWAELHGCLDRELQASIEPTFREIRDRQRGAFDEKLRQVTGAAANLHLKHPTMAAILQYGRLAVEILMVVWIGYKTYEAGYSILLLLLFWPLALGAVDALVRAGCKFFVDRFRDEIVRRQKEDVRASIQGGYLDPLMKLPPEIGGRLQEMAGVADRLPALLAEPAVRASA